MDEAGDARGGGRGVERVDSMRDAAADERGDFVHGDRDVHGVAERVRRECARGDDGESDGFHTSAIARSVGIRVGDE